ncbi:MAG TPA: TonB family protein [Terriglobales bacterium]|nr:TonB family protein [Terriglobales bacterium]
MAARADIYLEHGPWKRPLALSALLHGLLFVAIVAYNAVGWRVGESWGGGGGGDGAMSATLVSSVTVPLPASAAVTENVLANESRGVSQSLPQAAETPAPEAIAIPERATPAKPERTVTREKPRPQTPPQPSNVVPFGQGGPVSGPYGVFSTPNAKGGFSMTGGGGDFGSRYGWYVDVVRRKVSENWLKYEVDPSITSARRVYITFDILRNGEPTNIQVEQSSGVPSLDLSATRALQRIDTFGPLPSDYGGSRVSVEFWFDYRR